MSEMASVFSPMAQDIAPILAVIDGPERAGKVTPQDITALLATLHAASEHMLGEHAPDYVRTAFDTLLAALQRFGIEESTRRGELMLDSQASASSHSSAETDG